MTPAGEFNQRVDILHRRLEEDQLSQRQETWTAVKKCVPAKIVFTGGSEANETNQIVAHSTYKVTIRRRDGLSTQNRLRWRSLDLHIVNIAESPDDPTGRELIISCRT